MLNISGYNTNQREEKDASGHFRDPNRDYPGPCGTDGPYHLKSTASLAKFIEQENIISSATLHTYYPAVVYPWGMTTYNVSTHYDDIFKVMVNDATELSKYSVGNLGRLFIPPMVVLKIMHFGSQVYGQSCLNLAITIVQPRLKLMK